MTSHRPALSMGVVVGLVLHAITAAALEEKRSEADVIPVKQGQILEVTIPVSEPPITVESAWRGQRIRFFPSALPDLYVGLVGIDLAGTTGRDPLRVILAYPGRMESRRFDLDVIEESFPVQHLTLPKSMVDLDQKTLKRVRAEGKQLNAVFRDTTTPRLWSDAFVIPLDAPPSNAFGRKRVINGQPRNPHTGEDISAPSGTMVQAANDGIVRIAAEHFFSGNSIVLDHGLGLYTMYFHLSKVVVDEGEHVKRGTVIGLVGATGRATGSHLHWGARLNGARVDPFALIRLQAGPVPAAPVLVDEAGK